MYGYMDSRRAENGARQGPETRKRARSNIRETTTHAICSFINHCPPFIWQLDCTIKPGVSMLDCRIFPPCARVLGRKLSQASVAFASDPTSAEVPLLPESTTTPAYVFVAHHATAPTAARTHACCPRSHHTPSEQQTSAPHQLDSELCHHITTSSRYRSPPFPRLTPRHAAPHHSRRRNPTHPVQFRTRSITSGDASSRFP
ncbi:hypothetical protein BDV95DRAFT_595540 [Massariosphaeria phaeospora]|uniref:Uncharacterized protein n=1 Tax=Massariosphaeria phaeospora TaxID=100035 RepID=A0A7C8MJK3_9PLEO|nr:hypothetical protein BDV95DRAFT_595540 [Massariosphaeria phaeospora]